MRDVSEQAGKVEIMAPAGSLAMAAAAIRAGAGSIYFGVGALNMRARSACLEYGDLKKVTRMCRVGGVKSYLTLNTLVYDGDLEEIRRLCDAALEAGVSAVIATDIATILYARSIGLEVHMSVQANVANIEAVAFYAQFADVVVLARELSLEQIRGIVDGIRERDIRGPRGELVKVEIFIHGALCIAVSGKCGMSLATSGFSANRGQCHQPCRRKYRVVMEDTNQELVIDNEYVMSPRDICLVEHLDRILEAGVGVLKIEGRGRTPDYVATVVGVYREALEALGDGSYGKAKFAGWMERLGSVYNRKFWMGGYYCGEKLEDWSESNNSQSSLVRNQIGVVENVYQKIGVMEFRMFLEKLEPGEQILVEGPTTGAVRFTATGLHVDGKKAERAGKGDAVTLGIPARVRRGDKVYVLRPRVK